MKLTPQLMAAMAGGLLAVVLAVRFLYIPVLARLASQRVTLEVLQGKTTEAQALIAQRSAQEESLKRAQAQSQRLESQVRSQSIARILDRLSQQAKAHQLELTIVQEPVLEGTGGVVRFGPGLSLQEVPLRLQLQGRFRQVGEFLSGLRDAPFLAAVKQADIAKPSEPSGSILTTEILLAVYLPEQPV